MQKWRWWWWWPLPPLLLLDILAPFGGGGSACSFSGVGGRLCPLCGCGGCHHTLDCCCWWLFLPPMMVAGWRGEGGGREGRDSDSDSDSSMEASRNTDELRPPGRANTKKNPTTHGLGPRDHEARPHSVLVPSASTLTRDTAASAPPFHTQTNKGEFCDGPGVVSMGA